jgi:hypothetical protein
MRMSRADVLLEAMLRRVDRTVSSLVADAETSDQLRRQARAIYFRVNPRQRRRVQVHHRVPLEWRGLFPGADPNRLANLQGLATAAHRRKASDLWDAFRAAYVRLGRAPRPAEVVQYAGVVDRSLDLPMWLPAPGAPAAG